MKILRLISIVQALVFFSAVAEAAELVETNAVTNLTDGWRLMPFKYEIQHPYDLKTSDRYDFDATNNIHHFWIYFSDKPHAPPPNKTTARTEMRLETFSKGEHMFDGGVYVSPGTFACIAQVFDAAHGPVTMLIAHPD